MLLKELYELGHCNMIKGPISWRGALKKCIEPLVKDNSVDPAYANCLIENVEKYGPYIVLIPGVAMPHALEGANGANREAISFMRVSEPVHFENPAKPDTDAQIFFTLSDVDSRSHLTNIQRLVAVMSDEEVIERLKNMQSLKELLEIDKIVKDE